MNNPQGRWKTSYWFGDQEGYGDATSRTLPQERQFYADPREQGVSPFSVDNGVLSITALPNPFPSDHRFAAIYDDGLVPRGAPFPYLSGLLTTEKSFRQTYGYFEARLAFPSGRGFWPAFWMLPGREDYKGGDEIDVVEWVGINPERLVLSTHGGSKAQSRRLDGFADRAGFHLYGLLWTSDEITWFVDNRAVHSVRGHGLHKPMYLLLNLAVGGWGGNANEDPLAFPGALRADYVRAYSLRE